MKSINTKEAKQFVKIAAVLLRDHSPMTFEEVVMAFTYCWRQTESVKKAEAREASNK